MDWALVRQSHPKGKLLGYCHLHWHEPMCVHARVSTHRFGEGHSHCELRLALNRQHCSCQGLLSAGIIDLSHHAPCCGVLFFLKDVLPSPSTFKHHMKFKVCMDREKICTSQLSICLAVLSCHCRVVLGQGTSRDISVLSSLTPP